MNTDDDFSLQIKQDDSDKGIVRENLMFDGELLDDDGYVIYGQLHSYRAGDKRMTLDELHKQLWLWRCWRRCNGNCRMVARKMREFGWPGTNERQVKYRIRRMHKLGFFHTLKKKLPIP